MKVAVIIEGSTKHRSADVMKALEGLGHQVYNLGMKNVEGEPELSYIETGFMTALLLNLRAVDFVVGGCGTGQGYLGAVLAFPGTSCGLIYDPTEAWLYARVNAGNCVSLPLNKGYGGVGGDLNLRFMLERLWSGGYGAGHPAARAQLQAGARERLKRISANAHRPMEEILVGMDQTVVRRVLEFPGVLDFIKTAPASGLKELVLRISGGEA